MATNNSPSRFSTNAPRSFTPDKVDDFAMISLDSVEKMLRDTGEDDSRPLGNDYIPPPVFDGTDTKPAPRSPVLDVVTPSPPSVKAALHPATGSRFRYADMVRADGTVDTDAVYRYGQVPAVPLSAELLLQALGNLPADIPADARQIALKVTVNSLTQSAGIPVDTVIADASLRHTRLSQFRDALVAEAERECEPLQQEIQSTKNIIAAKQAEIIALCAEIEAKEEVSHRTVYDCSVQMARLSEVMDALQAD
ncbi:MAG: hypothetical protein H7Y38_13635 [Armatimonadetes bacterium]|nr:hypothetical protein [Armatimonadota bacterium]